MYHAPEDIQRLLPFALTAIIIPELLVILIVLAPGFFPSTCISEKNLTKKYRKAREARQNIHDSVVESAKTNSRLAVDDFMSAKKIIQIADLYQNNLDVSTLPKAALKNICRFTGMGYVGTTGSLQKKVAKHLAYIKEDDQYIRKEGIDSLSPVELNEACEMRGM
ncbi:LETM1-like protein-domain-containing protein [Dimargaris cristalligena]|uniref:LETM1-like protein-domain-containing protein n=1 Tax=Dimargaris cristalligena TaxID=215637 RepID=A0A4P9ZNP2_9FUNG|nr:LETM1-like protein-domain-containing protein [Dimargaris cristalligena]|eukprot:RKP34231.1 LETM1-like protein-domain-containing protein [Dimargaris cristalligena]